MTLAIKTLDQIKLTSYEESFLIGDLLTNKATILTGEPKAGKSLLAAGMVIALLNGEPDFLGLPIHRKVSRVVWGITDDGADEELKARLAGAVPLDSVRVVNIENNGDANYWVDVRDTLREQEADLFVLDHILGSLAPGEDISSSTVASKIATNLKIVGGGGVPVLALTHTPKGPGDGLSTASSVIGGRMGAAGSRGVATLRVNKKRGKRLCTAMNRGRADLELLVTVERKSPDSEVPVWSLMRADPEASRSASRARSEASKAGLAQLAEHLVSTQPTGVHSFNAAGGVMQESVTVSV